MRPRWPLVVSARHPTAAKATKATNEAMRWRCIDGDGTNARFRGIQESASAHVDDMSEPTPPTKVDATDDTVLAVPRPPAATGGG